MTTSNITTSNMTQTGNTTTPGDAASRNPELSTLWLATIDDEALLAAIARGTTFEARDGARAHVRRIAEFEFAEPVEIVETTHGLYGLTRFRRAALLADLLPLARGDIEPHDLTDTSTPNAPARFEAFAPGYDATTPAPATHAALATLADCFDALSPTAPIPPRVDAALTFFDAAVAQSDPAMQAYLHVSALRALTITRERDANLYTPQFTTRLMSLTNTTQAEAETFNEFFLSLAIGQRVEPNAAYLGTSARRLFPDIARVTRDVLVGIVKARSFAHFRTEASLIEALTNQKILAKEKSEAST